MTSTTKTTAETIHRITTPSWKDLLDQLSNLKIELSDVLNVSIHPSISNLWNYNLYNAKVEYVFEIKVKEKNVSVQEIENAKKLLLKEGYIVSLNPQYSACSSLSPLHSLPLSSLSPSLAALSPITISPITQAQLDVFKNLPKS